MALQKRQRALDIRKESLYKRVCVPDIPVGLHEAVFGDFLTTERVRPVKGIMKVVADIRSYMAFQQHDGSQFHILFERFRQDPSGFDAFVRDLGPFQEKRDKALTQEWSRIATFLRPWDVSSLRKASPAFAMARHEVYVSWKKRMVRHIGMDDFRDPRAHRRLVDYFRRRFSSDTSCTETFVRNICRALALTTRQRRQLLEMELKNHGLTLDDHCQIYTDYIRGDTDASRQEIVATMKLAEFLFRRTGHRCWLCSHYRLQGRMRLLERTGEVKTWYQGADLVMNEILNRS